MKSIEATLKLVSNIIAGLCKTAGINIDIALAGGYAVIAQGVARTTTDIDFFLYFERDRQTTTTGFFKLFEKAVPGNFKAQFVQGSKMHGDPFPYDIIFLTDETGEYPRIDFIIPRYKWELEGIKASRPLEDIPFPVLPRPYLIAMKLKAAGPKDNFDIVELYNLLTGEEKKKTGELAALIRRDRYLSRLLETVREKNEEPEDEDLLIR